MKTSRDAFYRDLHASHRKNTPRIVFVPGILGSKIEECQADGTQCTPIWGTINSFRQDIDLTINPERKYRTDVVSDVLFLQFYGPIIDYVRKKASLIASDTPTDPLVSVFAYDWRQSNTISAKLLADRICDIRKSAPDFPIIILAHSMGGLVTKIWAAHYGSQTCPNGAKPSVQEIVFVATPFLGAPKTIKAILVGYDALFDEISGITSYLGWFERNHVLYALNSAGISFQSLFELLPIRSSTYCQNVKSSLTKVYDPVDDENSQPIDLFDVSVWKRYDLLHRIGSSAARQSFYDNSLEEMLIKAEVTLCDIVDFDPSSVVDNVEYVYGKEKDLSTYGWFQLWPGKPDAIKASNEVQGDDTVPTYSAQNYLTSKTSQTIEVEANHLSIVSSQPVLAMVDQWYANANKRADIETVRAKPEYASLLSIEKAKAGDFIPVSLDPTKWANADESFAIKINSKALGWTVHDPSYVARIASFSEDPVERANLYAIAASSEQNPKQQVIWVNDLARSAYAASYFDDAIKSANLATSNSNGLLQKGGVTVEQQADEVAGWSYLRKGETQKFDELANKFSKKYFLAKDAFKEPQWLMPEADISLYEKNWFEGKSGKKVLEDLILLPKVQ